MRAPFTWLSFSIVVVAGSFLCHSQACSSDSFNDDTNQLPVKNVVVSNSYLCRMCGSSLEDAGSFLQVASPFCLGEKNETVVAKKGSGVAVATITLQRLTNPAGIEFEVLAVKKSSCTGVGKWESVASWFPGYSWKACVCNQCGRHLGWMFEDSSLVKGSIPVKPSDTGFYVLIRDNLLTESVAETLTYVPKIFRQQ